MKELGGLGLLNTISRPPPQTRRQGGVEFDHKCVLARSQSGADRGEELEAAGK